MAAAQLSTIETQLFRTVSRPKFAMGEGAKEEKLRSLTPNVYSERRGPNLRKETSTIENGCCTIEQN